MEALAFLFGEGCVVVVFQKRKHPRQILLRQLNNLLFHLLNIDPILGQILQHHLQAPLTSPAKRLCTIHKLLTILIQTIVRQVHIRIFKIFIRWLFIILCTKPSQPLLVQETYVGLD